MELRTEFKKNTLNYALLAFLLLIFLFPNYAFAQKKTKYSGVGFNQDKIELLYKDISQTTTYSSGRVSNSTYSAPLLRINNATPVDYNPDLLLPYLEKCPTAKREVISYKAAKKASTESLLKNILIGGAVGIGCLVGSVVTVEKNPKLSTPLFFGGLGVGAGFVVNGLIQGQRKHKKARKHLEQSVVFYNDKCYKAPAIVPADTIKPTEPAPATPETTSATPLKNSGVIDNYQDTFFYKLLRNDPKNSRYVALSAILLESEVANFHEFNYQLGGNVYYQHSARFAIEGTFRTAILDNFSENTSKGRFTSPNLPSAKGIINGDAVDYKRWREMSVVASIEFAHRNRIRTEEIFLGKTTIQQREVQQLGNLKADRRISWAARVGATDHRSVWYNGNLPFETSEIPPTNFEYNLRPGMAMVQSTSLTLGISRRSLRDVKISVKGEKKEKIREEVGYTEFYADACYAPRLTVGDIYEVSRDFPNDTYTAQALPADKTPTENIGWRAGFRAAPYRGAIIGLEIGQRPGPNESRSYLLLSGQIRLGLVLKK